jgi:protein phosphatase
MAGIESADWSIDSPAALAEGVHLPATLRWAALSDPGGARRHNEDAWLSDESSRVFALADGMGGLNAGELASALAVRAVTEVAAACLDAGLPPEQALSQACLDAHSRIKEVVRMRADCLGMATTLVVAAIADARLTIAHVGDSRAYLLREGRLERLTTDHSVGQQMLEAGQLSEAQIRRLPARGILTRALGTDAIAPLPQIMTIDWRRDDLLMLCSDGLTDSLVDHSLEALLHQPQSDLQGIAAMLVDAALEAGCTDNITVVLAGGPFNRPVNH